MAIITAIYSFSLQLSLTPPPPRPSLSAIVRFFPLCITHAHTQTHSLSFSLFRCSPLPSTHSPFPPFRRPERADALVWPVSARLAVNGSLNPPPRRLLSRCWPVSSKPRDLSSFECNAVVRHGCTQTELRASFSLPPSLLTSIVPLSYPRPSRTHTRARISATGADSRGTRDTDEAATAAAATATATTTTITSIVAAAIRLLLVEYECTDRRARKCASICTHICMRYMSVGDWMRGNCQWNCPQLRRRNEGRVHRLTIDRREQGVAGSNELFHRYLRWKVVHDEEGTGISLRFSCARQDLGRTSPNLPYLTNIDKKLTSPYALLSQYLNFAFLLSNEKNKRFSRFSLRNILVYAFNLPSSTLDFVSWKQLR